MNTLSKEIAHGTESQIQTIQDIYSMSRNIYLDNSFEFYIFTTIVGLTIGIENFMH